MKAAGNLAYQRKAANRLETGAFQEISGGFTHITQKNKPLGSRPVTRRGAENFSPSLEKYVGHCLKVLDIV